MTREERAVEILKNELACVRNVDCERSECRNCNLVMPEHDITEALQIAIKALEQEPMFIAKSDGTIEQIKNCEDCLFRKEWEKIGKLLSVILDKIRAEIEQTVSRYSISRERGCTGQVEWSDRLIKESEVLQIIDKYKAESEDVFSDYPDMPYQFDNMTGSMNL